MDNDPPLDIAGIEECGGFVITGPQKPYATAPKDGRYIKISRIFGEPAVMRWDAEIGKWSNEDGNVVWSDTDPAYAPHQWEPLT